MHNMHEGKNLSDNRAIVEMDAPRIVSVPLYQNVGAPAKAIVQKGDRVLMGQPICEPQGFVSTVVHSSVSGKVEDIRNITGINGKPVRAVIIENDFLDEKCYMPPADYTKMEPGEIVERIRDAGIVGMGGATFPLHVKLSPPPDKKIDLLIINGAECEPFLTADHRVMIEQADKIVYGAAILKKALGVTRAVMGIEDNKLDAAESVRNAAGAGELDVQVVKTKYPQGSEKQLIEALTDRQVPSGGLPMDAGVVAVNASSAVAVADAFLTGEPLIRRVVTVTGAVADPKNMLVRIGTDTQSLIDAAGGYIGEPLKLISGGPMMGLPVPTPECVITKGYSGVLVLDARYTKKEHESNCIRCGRCVDACPMFLYPSRISEAAAGEDFDRAEEINAMDCMSCGSCSYVCPAKKPLAQNIKFAKEMITVNRLKEKQRAQEENC